MFISGRLLFRLSTSVSFTSVWLLSSDFRRGMAAFMDARLDSSASLRAVSKMATRSDVDRLRCFLSMRGLLDVSAEKDTFVRGLRGRFGGLP